MRWLRRWIRPHPMLAKRPQRPFFAEAPQAPEPDVPPRGCAWFDSSHELMRGLVVREIEVALSQR